MVPAALAGPVDRLSRFFGLLVLGNLALLGFYEFVTFKYEVHSDSAVKVLLANEILETGELFPHEWVYANGDVYAFFCHTLALPLVPLFGPGFVTHAFVGLLTSLGLLWLTALLLRELAFPRWQRLAMLALFASGISSLFAENLFGQATYGFIVALNVAVVVVALAFSRRFDSAATVDRRLLALLGVLSLVVTWNNPKRAAIMLSAPLLAACAGAVFTRVGDGRWSLERLKRIPAVWVALVHGVGAGLGVVCSIVVLSRPLTNVDTAGATTWLSTDPIWRNVVHAVLGSLAQVGALPLPGYSVVSAWGLYEAGRMVLGGVLVWGAIRAVRALLNSASEAARFVALFTAVSGGLSLFFFVFTNVPDMSNPMASARYLLPTLYMGLALLPGLISERPTTGGKTSLALFASVTVTALLGFMTLALPGYGSTGRTWADARARGDARFTLMEFLEKEGLRYGYASYWNAGALTLLSNGRLKVRQVHPEGLLAPNHLHSSNRWFRETAWTGETFLLLTQAEFSRVDLKLLDSRLGSTARVLSFGAYRVLVYPKNLAGLPGWADLIEGTQRFPVSPSSPHLVGSYQPLAAGQGALVSEKGTKGDLLFGPFMWLASGRYRVAFEVQADGEGPVGTLQVTARQSALVLASQPLVAGARGQQVLEFEVQQEEKFVEFRVLASGTGSISVFGTSVERQGR